MALRDKVARRLFPKSKLIRGAVAPAARKPPEKEWIPSNQQELPIDDSLFELQKRKLLRAYDSHVVARRWIELAELRAWMDLEKRRSSEQHLAASLQNSEDAARKLGDKIAEFLAASHDWRVAPGFGYRASRMDYSKHNEAGRATDAALDAIAAARRATETLRGLASAQRAQLIPSHASGDVWRQGFVAMLCFCWRDLTGQNPTAESHLFRRFVDNCYLSLAGNEFTASCIRVPNTKLVVDHPDELPPFKSWIGVVRTVVKDFESRPDWDGFERYERLLDPPGAGVEVNNETFAEHQRRDAAKANAEAAALQAVPGLRESLNQIRARHVRKGNKAPK